MNQPSFVRAIVSKENEATKIEWSHDTAWRFMPTREDSDAGYVLDPIDLAVNKILALAGRNEVRDYLDVIYLHRDLLPLGALCWAAAGKDPGFTPHALLEILKRRGRYQQADLDRLQLRTAVNLTDLKREWLTALEEAEQFLASRPAEEAGCLYYSKKARKFIAPQGADADVVLHWGRPGGVLPKFE